MNIINNKDVIGYTLRGGGKVIGLTGRDNDNKQLFLCRCKCGIEFMCKKINIIGSSRNKPRYGCRKCSSKYRGKFFRKIKETIGKKFNRLKVIAVIGTNKHKSYHYKCKCDCGNYSVVNGSDLRSGNSQSCGCLNREIVKSRLGSKHHNWNPDLTDEDRKKQRPLPLELKQKVFGRDRYCCQKCNLKKDIIIHHLDGYHWYVEGRLVSDNLITLCIVCHKQFHKTYGRKYNTKEQFKEFLNII